RWECCFFFSSRRRHTRSKRDWSSDVCSSDLMMRAHLTRLCVRHDAVARALLLTLAVTFSEVAQSNPAQLSAQTADVRDFHSVAGPVVYAATQGGGLQKSSDNGATWLKVTALPARYLWKITG